MKKLVYGPVNDDNFGPGWTEADLRPEILAEARREDMSEPFSTEVLRSMSLNEVFATWNAFVRRNEDKRTRWLHSSFVWFMLLYMSLDATAKRTFDVVPLDWYDMPIATLLDGGKAMSECSCPGPGVEKPGWEWVIPGLDLRMITARHSAFEIWYEKLTNAR